MFLSKLLAAIFLSDCETLDIVSCLFEMQIVALVFACDKNGGTLQHCILYVYTMLKKEADGCISGAALVYLQAFSRLLTDPLGGEYTPEYNCCTHSQRSISII